MTDNEVTRNVLKAFDEFFMHVDDSLFLSNPAFGVLSKALADARIHCNYSLDPKVGVEDNKGYDAFRKGSERKF